LSNTCNSRRVAGSNRAQPGQHDAAPSVLPDPARVFALVSAISELRLGKQHPCRADAGLLSFEPVHEGMEPDKSPGQRPFKLWWQVLGSNQRRRCRQTYRPPDNLALTRSNTTSGRFQGPYRDRTAVSGRTYAASAECRPGWNFTRCRWLEYHCVSVVVAYPYSLRSADSRRRKGVLTTFARFTGGSRSVRTTVSRASSVSASETGIVTTLR